MTSVVKSDNISRENACTEELVLFPGSGQPRKTVKLGDDLWVIHAFQKKSKQGIRTPKFEIDLIRDRLKRLKEALK